MRASFNINNKMTMIAEMRNDTVFQILEYDDLGENLAPKISMKLDYIKREKNKLRQARIILDNSEIKVEPGKLSYFKGEINIENKGGFVGIGKKLISNIVMKEAAHKPVVEGSGEVFLEPAFENFILLELEDEEIIIDNKAFCACESSIEITTLREIRDPYLEEYSNMLKLMGSGIVLITIPVSHKEILKCKIYRDSIKINGDIVLLRSGSIEHEIEKISSNLLGDSSEGKFLNIYNGTGELWLAPTIKVYENLREKIEEDMIEYLRDIENTRN